MNRIILYVAALLLLFSVMHYIVSTSTSLTTLNLTIPVVNRQQDTTIRPAIIYRKGNNGTDSNITIAFTPYSVSRGKDKENKEDLFHKILGVILGVLSAISMFIKFLIDLTIIRIPQPQINETKANVSSVNVNPLNIVIVLTLSAALSIVLLLLSSRRNIRLRKYVKTLEASRRARLGFAESRGRGLDFNDIRSAIISSFQHLYVLARENLGLSDAKTPREIAMGFEEMGIGDEAWLIASAFEELKYGGKVPSWLSLKDLREAVSTIDGKIMKWSNR